MSKLTWEEEIRMQNQYISLKDLQFLKPLVVYYRMGGFNNLPVQVENAIDSLMSLMGVNDAGRE